MHSHSHAPGNPSGAASNLFHDLEMSIASADPSDGSLGDWNVRESLQALIRAYVFEQRGKAYRPPKLVGQELVLYERVRVVCEWLLGRETKANAEQALAGRGHLVSAPTQPEPVDQILKVLRQIVSSSETHSDRGGRRGYLEFLRDFLAGHSH